jgi:hypothetical protein
MAWFEVPVYQDDARLVAYLCRQTTIPAGGGTERGPPLEALGANSESGGGHNSAQRGQKDLNPLLRGPL